MGITLVIGREDDLCCRLVKHHLDAAGREVLFLPENELFPGLHFAWELRNGDSCGSVGFAAQKFKFDQIDAVLARFSGITTSPDEYQTKDGQYLNSEWHALARGYVHSFPCPVINRLRPELWYKARLSVPDLISLTPGLKFRVPRATVTTRFEDARTFFHLCGGRIRYSPLSVPSNYIIDCQQDLEKLEPLSKVLPLYLTEIVPGSAVRAFVVSDEVVFDDQPHALAARFCLEAAASLGLAFCEFELLRTANDEWYCLGINCVPQLFQCADQTIAAIINRLVGALCAAQRRAA